jgi:hypothetical protein
MFMDYKFFLQRLRYIILNPVRAWDIISEENRTTRDVRNSFLFPLLLLVTICVFTGSMVFTNSTLPPVYSVFVAIKFLLLDFVVIFASAAILGEITRPLDLGRSFTLSFQLIVYSITPLLICQMITQLFESLVFVNILSLFGLYIFWTGSNKMLNPPQHKKMFLLVTTFIVVAELFIAGSVALSSVVDRIYFGFFA